jgi:hypothetical protein
MRRRRELATIHFLMSGCSPQANSFQSAEFSAVQLGCALGNDLGADLGSVKESCEIVNNATDEDMLARIGRRSNIHVNPSAAMSVTNQA